MVDGPVQPLPEETCDPNMSIAAQRYWTTRGWEEKAHELTRLRAAAGQWKTTVAALAGASVIVTVLTGYDALRALTHLWEITANILLLLALGCAVRAIVLASRAELGPLTPQVLDPATICAYYTTEPGVARAAILRSKWWTAGSVLFLVLAIGVIGYFPRTTVPPPSYVALPRQGPAVCGQLATGSVGVIALRPRGGATPIPLHDLLALTEVKTCP